MKLIADLIANSERLRPTNFCVILIYLWGVIKSKYEAPLYISKYLLNIVEII
jgi:hypothetical protein